MGKPDLLPGLSWRTLAFEKLRVGHVESREYFLHDRDEQCDFRVYESA